MDQESLSTKKVAELKKLAKEVGVKPLPTRKAELIGTILVAKGSKAPPTGQEITEKQYTFSELQEICRKHKYQHSFNCGGAGVTKKSLFENLAREGLLEGFEIAPKENNFKKELLEVDPEFYKDIEAVVPSLPDTRKLFSDVQRREAKDAPWLPWMEVHREHGTLMLAVDGKGKRELARVFAFVTEDKATETILEDIRVFADQLPLMSYLYARLKPDFLALCSQGGISRPFEISEAISSPTKKLEKISAVERALSGDAGDVLVEQEFDLGLEGLPTDIAGEIMRFVPFSSHSDAVIASKFFRKGEKQYRTLRYTYGSYTLTTAQATAMKWMDEKFRGSQLLTLKAPPSWGKTVMMLAAAIEAINRGKKVILYTTKAMLETFLREMRIMMANKFPDISLHRAQDGKYNLLIPSLDENEQKRFLNRDPADLLLLTHDYHAKHALATYLQSRGGQQWTRRSPIEDYAADLVIIDEAHKGHVVSRVWDNLFRNDKALFLLLSATDVIVNNSNHGQAFMEIVVPPGEQKRDYFFVRYTSPQFNQAEGVKLNPASIRFLRRSIEKKIPDYTLEMRAQSIIAWDASIFLPALMHASRAYNALSWTSGDERYSLNAFDPNNYLRILEVIRETSGNVVVFSKALPKYTKNIRNAIRTAFTTFKAKDHPQVSIDDILAFYDNKSDIILHRTGRDIERFVRKSQTEPSTFLTTYAKGGEGINLNTVGTIVLMDATKVSAANFYQAISRALRVKNRAKSVRVIAVADKRNLLTAAKIRFNNTSEDFRDAYKKLLRTKTYENPVLRPGLLRELLRPGVSLTEEELYVLMGPPLEHLPAKKFFEIETFFEQNEMFREVGMSLYELMNRIEGSYMPVMLKKGEKLKYSDLADLLWAETPQEVPHLHLKK